MIDECSNRSKFCCVNGILSLFVPSVQGKSRKAICESRFGRERLLAELKTDTCMQNNSITHISKR